jgi:hypothetical protein
LAEQLTSKQVLNTKHTVNGIPWRSIILSPPTALLSPFLLPDVYLDKAETINLGWREYFIFFKLIKQYHITWFLVIKKFATSDLY